MTITEYLNNAREIFSTEFNPFIESLDLGLPLVENFVNSELAVRKADYSMALYLDSPTGTTYKETDADIQVGLTVSFYLNEDMTEESVEINDLYFASIIAFIKSKQFSEYDLIGDSIIVRMDEYEGSYNGSAFLINSRLSTHYGYDF